MIPFNHKDIIKTFELFHGPEDVVEIRIPRSYTHPEYKKVVHGYFNNAEVFVNAVMEFPDHYNYDGGIYATINVINPDLLARSANMFRTDGATTSADDIIRRKWIFVDIDPVRPSDISSTDEEHDIALKLAQIIKRDLVSEGWPQDSFVLADSGNGAYLFIHIDMPNDKESSDLINNVVKSLSSKYSNEFVHIDEVTVDASRIMKVVGTVAKKGSDVPNRPHRLSKFVEIPGETPVPVSIEQLKMQVIANPVTEVPVRSLCNNDLFDPEEFAEEHNLEVIEVKETNHGRLAILKECPFNPSHNRGEVYIGRHPDGARMFKCFHESCKDNKWEQLKAKLKESEIPIEAKNARDFILSSLQEEAKKNVGEPFKPENITALALMKIHYLNEFETLMGEWRGRVRVGELREKVEEEISSIFYQEEAENAEPIEMGNISLDSIRECLEIHPKTGFVLLVSSKSLAHWVLSTRSILTIIETQEMLVYSKGKYEPNGKQFVQKLLVKGLDPFTKENGKPCYNSGLLTQVLSIIEGLTFIHLDDFDSDLDIINVRNGLVNWRTMEFKEHTPDYHSRIQLPVDYNPNADCPNIRTMHETIIAPADRTKALEFIGYCLYRKYPIQKAFILLGPGGTGKSHFIDVIIQLLGPENVSAVSMHDQEKDRFATSDLHNKLLNTFGDMEQTSLPNVNVLKLLTSNKDIIRAQKKGEPAFNFINFAKLLFAANKLPVVGDDTTGFYRRVEILLFEHVFKHEEYNAKFIDTVTTPTELSGLLNMVLVRLPDLIDRNEFTNQSTTADTQEKYKTASNPTQVFLDAYVSEVSEAKVSKDELYEYYKTFCEEMTGTKPPLSPIKFTKYIYDHLKWCPRPRDSNEENMNFYGTTRRGWKNTKFDKILWDARKVS